MRDIKKTFFSENKNVQTEYNERKKKLNIMKQKGFIFPNNFQPNFTTKIIQKKYNFLNKQQLENIKIFVKIAGRIINKRIMGKASFFTIKDIRYTIQLYLKEETISLNLYQDYINNWDIGDIIGAEGILFKTNTNELTIRCTTLILLNKSIYPLPDKFHGLINKEIKYRKRYIDLIANDDQFKIFEKRFQIIQFIRKFMIQKNFLEVETPMLHNIPGGANARPFSTYHNVLNKKMYLRISPELYLKRLIIGGFSRIFEINRSFRNEGISNKHNPEFTMMEIYQSYATYKDMMRLIEVLFKNIALKINKTDVVNYQDYSFNFNEKFEKLSIKNAILKFNPEIHVSELDNLKSIKKIASTLDINIEPTWSIEKIQIEIFEKNTEKKIIQPTFITEYPIDVSPLSRKTNNNHKITERFELFIHGMEIANGFSELNDFEDQKIRFKKQLKNKTTKNYETHNFYDHEYVTALKYGLPPTAGLGIGIDRLVMLLTNSKNIRDVILFPALRSFEL
ncbi:lysine--tRNA ligase [Buchnera aphidicola (Thelaxes californica)]|uniref:Lysine--tRNA ligase n=1 Tax=Buchnera aphidicola (Thelaxes californica) TaxID=1315998 RepID=A0A4D6YJU5_9GAMM|nr:lysine--tRNA ligase [Buchnera aphidicola]QCI26861.1 lysine--tRNA ligase [Buchnera aphidicola (Thelaxes californica)]